MSNDVNLGNIAQLIRYWILVSTTKAGSGHPTSSLSATDLMTTLLFGGAFRFDVKKPDYPNNDRLIFSKGHASPLFYALWAAAGAISEKELVKYRHFESTLEGHPTPRFKFTEAATGSLGQGLSIGVGMALNAKYLDRLPYRTFVLLGDSEMAEGSVWEAIQSAAHYKLDNLIGILDVNRLGQRGETMYGRDIQAYKRRLIAFGWDVIVCDGHTIEGIQLAFEEACLSRKPVMIIAQTKKGKGVSFLEDKNGWHGKVLNETELERALSEMGPVDVKARGTIAAPKRIKKKKLTIKKQKIRIASLALSNSELVATRKAYGVALSKEMEENPRIIALDAEVSNSTYSEIAQKAFPKRFFEMFIAEQNMVGVALGLSRRGKKPFVSTFAAFLTRAHDQIRMAQYSNADICFVGSHAGVSIGEDGPSQMGLEDIAMFRALHKSVVLYPADAIATEKLVNEASRYSGISYIRTTRGATPMIYPQSQLFSIGGSKILRHSRRDSATVVACGITLHEALKAYDALKKQKIMIRVIDCYSIKPIDSQTLRRAAQQTKHIITVEDHVPEGGLGEAVAMAVTGTKTPVISLAVRKIPRSGSSEKLLSYEEINADSIVRRVKKL